MKQVSLPNDLARMGRRLRVRAGAFVVDGSFKVLASMGRLDPRSRPERNDLDLVRDVPYLDDRLPEHRLDVWRPRGGGGLRPVVLYLHGGGFRILSKETHYVMTIAYARQGYVVFNANYRLAPAHPFPAALEDAAAAYAWVVEHAREHGGDPERIVLAGESAGANLATALAVCAALPRPEPLAAKVRSAGVRPAALVAACGVLQVSDTQRFQRRSGSHPTAFIQDRLDEVGEAYLAGADPARPGGLELADPLVILERAETLPHGFPPTFACAGTRDPLLDDARRLVAALEARGASCELRVYPGELHAFNALVWRAQAREAWRHTFAFLERFVGRREAA